MTYTRRSFLRDAALLSAAAGSSSLLSGCEDKHFDNGIRIFFAGAWLFCGIRGGKMPDYMYAITLDPQPSSSQPTDPCHPNTPVPSNPAPSSGPNMSHRFPHGVWQISNQPWDTVTRTELCHNPQSDPDHPTNHFISILGNWRRPSSSLPDLFEKANTISRFTYLPVSQNSSKPYKINLKHDTIRIVTVPRPTRIIPAAFRPDVEVEGKTELLMTRGLKDKGIATTHIFEYRGADALTFSPADGGAPFEVLRGKDFYADYHFHSVPKAPNDSHARYMFSSLVSLVCGLGSSNPDPNTDLLSINPRPCARDAVPGNSVPKEVTNYELQIDLSSPPSCPPLSPSDFPMHLNLASCGSGGLAVDI